MGHVTGLRCAECGAVYEERATHVCEECFGPLEVSYDYDAIARVLTRERIEAGPRNLWRYRDLLPLAQETDIGPYSGLTPLVRADRLAREIGAAELHIKDDSVNHPTFSYKDRVVPVAIAKAVELGFDTVACASTGNLANSVAAHASRAGLACFIFVPEGLERGKVIGSAIYAPNLVAVRGNYDEVDRLCSEIGESYGWGFVNINLRPYYTEGSKTYAYEIVEQLGWTMPQHVVVPTAGGTLLPKLAQGFAELSRLGLASGAPPKIYTAQAAGSAPIVTALHSGADTIKPVKPNTIAKSIAIGDPGAGYEVLATVRQSGGWGESASDQEIVDAIKALARCEGMFAEPAGGVTIAAARKLIEQGRIPADESVVVCMTGNGYKTVESVAEYVDDGHVIDARLGDFDTLYRGLNSRQSQEMVARKPVAS